MLFSLCFYSPVHQKGYRVKQSPLQESDQQSLHPHRGLKVCRWDRRTVCQHFLQPAVQFWPPYAHHDEHPQVPDMQLPTQTHHLTWLRRVKWPPHPSRFLTPHPRSSSCGERRHLWVKRQYDDMFCQRTSRVAQDCQRCMQMSLCASIHTQDYCTFLKNKNIQSIPCSKWAVY